MENKKNDTNALICVLIGLGILVLGLLTIGLMLAAGRH